MTRSEETSNLINQMKPMFNKLGELTKKETDRLGTLFARWLVLNNEHLAEIKETADRTSEEIENVKETLNEYETTIAMMEAFLIENDLYENFLVFSDELINEFLKDQKPKLHLV